MVRPRFAWAPPRSRSLGRDCIDWWRAAGGRLFGWQEFVIEEILGLGDDDRWVSTNDGLDVARQNGKGVILQAVEGFFAFELGYPVVMHTAHEVLTALEHQTRLEALIQDAPHLHKLVKDRGGYMRANGRESINLKSGCRIVFRARTKGSGRGYSGDLLVWDEAMVIPDTVAGAQMPMTRASQARHGRKVIYAGSAVDQMVHEHGQMFARLRERGLAKDPRVSWHEWAAADDLSQLTDEMLRDRRSWRAANPSMEDGLVSEETMEDEIASMPPRQTAVELFGAGDWPRLDGKAASVINGEKWDALGDARGRLEDPVCFGVAVAPDRSWSTVAAAGLRGDGLLQIAVIARKRGTGWLAGWVAGRVETHEPTAVMCNGVGAASTMRHQFEEAGVDLVMVDAGGYASACGRLFDLVEQGQLRHHPDDDLTAAARAAGKRALGGRFAWSSAGAAADVSPLEAATLALWGAETGEADTGPMVAFG